MFDISIETDYGYVYKFPNDESTIYGINFCCESLASSYKGELTQIVNNRDVLGDLTTSTKHVKKIVITCDEGVENAKLQLTLEDITFTGYKQFMAVDDLVIETIYYFQALKMMPWKKVV